MNDLDFFAEQPFEKYLLEGEKVVWSGRARALLKIADWLPSLFLSLAAIPTCVVFMLALTLPHGGSPLVGVVMGGITLWLWSTAALRPIWMIQHLQRVRYAVTTQRALVLNGVAYRHSFPLIKDWAELRAVSLEDLSQRVGPDENGTLTLGVIAIVRFLCQERRAIGFYACDEVEGAELEILRLRGELPPAENRDFDEISPTANRSLPGLAAVKRQRKSMP